MEFLRKTGALVVMLMLTSTALPIFSSADVEINPCVLNPTLPLCGGGPPPGPTQTSGVDFDVNINTVGPVTIQLQTNFGGGDEVTYAISQDPEHGTLGPIDGNGQVVYTPNGTFVDGDYFTYTSSQNGSTSTNGSVSILLSSAPVDSTAPIITAPATQYFSTTTIPASPIIIAATATDETDPSPVITSDAPATFPVGTTTITWTATDAAGNHSSVTSEVGIILVDQYRISSDKTAATTTESFTATALTFDGTGTYIPAAGAIIGVVLSSSTSTVATTSIADANGQATFSVGTAGSYLIGLQNDLYATTTPITITEIIPDPIPTPTPAPVVTGSAGNGPPVASAPVYTAPAAPITQATAPGPAPSFVYSDTAASVLTPTPVTSITAPPQAEVVTSKPEVLAAETQPTSPDPTPTIETSPAQAQPLAVAQSAAALIPADNAVYELLGLVIVLLALAGLTWQWKKRRER